MSDLIAVTGNVTGPPVLHNTGGGVPMVTFGLATTERRFDNGEWRDGHTNFFSVSAFRALGEHAFASLEKGQRVVVVGRLRVRRWEAGGRTGTSIDLEASSLGPDLMFGVASFRRAGGGAFDDAPRGEAAPGGGAPEADVRSETADGLTTAPAEGGGWAPATAPDVRPGDPAAGVAVPSEERLVAAGGWGAVPDPEDDPPF